MNAETNAGQILIVDDNPMNLDVLRRVLGSFHFRVRLVPSGQLALQSARHLPPDVILLDINMPEMDGYQTCEEMKRDPALKDIPVIFLSALDDVLDKVKAFKVGGADYLSKPFQAEEVLIRVQHQIRLKHLQDELAIRNANLEMANLKLLEVDKLKAGFTAMLVHDLRSPLTSISASLDLFEEEKQLDLEVLRRCRHNMKTMISMMNDLLEIYRTDGAQMPLDLKHVSPLEVVSTVQANFLPLCRKQDVQLLIQAPARLPIILADEQKMERVISNLVGNALKYTPADGTINIIADVLDGTGVETGLRWVTIRVEDTGRGISPDQLPYIFDPYHQATRKDANLGVGLGLAIVQRVMAAHKGRVNVRSQPGVGTAFMLFFPLDENLPEIAQA